MTRDHDDASEDTLAGIDLHAWRVPPPAAVDRPSLLVRALSPAANPPRRPRLRWIVAAIVVLNAAIATLIVILLARAPATPSIVTVRPAGGGSVDTQVRDLLRRLEQEQRALERKLAEIQELRALVAELSERLRQYERQDERRERRDRAMPEQPDRRTPDRVDRPPLDPDAPGPSDLGSCDEVSCVLANYEGTCCAKFRRARAPIAEQSPSTGSLPDTLDRQSVSKGIAAVRARVAACADRSTVRGNVRVRVRVGADGLVRSVAVDATPDAALGACVAAAVQRAVFERTQHGGSFSYPFAFSSR